MFGFWKFPVPFLPHISLTVIAVRAVNASRRCISGLGGGTVKGVSRPGSIVWSRVYVEEGKLKCDLGLGKVVTLPDEETNERWQTDNTGMAYYARGFTRREPRSNDGAT